MEETKKTKEEVTEEVSEEDLIPAKDLPQDEDESNVEDKSTETPLVEEKRTVEKLISETTVEKPTFEVPLQPTPVPGETERETALRLEIQRLRTKLRGDSIKNIIEKPEVKEVIDPYKELREKGYNDDEIKQMETAVDVIARNKGYIRADDSYKQTMQNVIDLFIDEHTEYKPLNDKDDLRWNTFQSILQDGTYNLSGKTPKQLKTIFSRIDEDVKRELGEPIVVTNKNQIAAQQHKINVASHSGGTKTTPESKSKIDYNKPIGGIQFKGFNDED